MRDVPFQTGGPLPYDSPVYVDRKADQVALRHLHQMHYLQLTEPRQQGKTSLIYRLRSKLSDGGYVFVYVDAEGLEPGNYPDWYAALTRRLITQLECSPELRSCFSEDCPLHSLAWRECLAHVARAGQRKSKRIVIALDEIGSVPAEWAESFFRVLREAYVVREVEPYFKHITFILAGAFDPRDLIADSKISPFNVAQRVHLEDFTSDELGQLVAHLELPTPRVLRVADRLAYWTDGQPYLAQKVCSYLAESEDAVDAGAVDDAVGHFFREDTNHLPRIATDLKADDELLDYARSVIAGKVRFSPAVNPAHFQLAHVIGVIKPDEHGFCRIRNRMYEQALAEIGALPDTNPDEEIQLQPQDEFQYDAFISYSHHDSVWVRDTLLPHLEGEGLRICIDFRDFELGAPSLVNMENAVDRSRKTLLVLTPNWVASEWTEFEALLIQTRDPAGRGRRILPLMVQRCELPARLAVFTYLDLTDPAEFDFQMRRLAAAIRSAPQPPVQTTVVRVQEPVPHARSMVGDFNHKRGLAALGESLAQTDVETRLSFTVLESRMLENLQDERDYGINETIRSERARITRELNRLALTHLEHSFNDLCRAKEETHAAFRPKPESTQPLPASQPVSSEIPDLRLLAAGSSGEQLASRLEFSIPPHDPAKKLAHGVEFRLYLDNPRPTMARYVEIDMRVTSDTDSFWMYGYKNEPFLIEESPRPWKITLSDAYIRCCFKGGADFVCHSEVQQDLGLVKMLIPYGQPNTTVTFGYCILAEGCKSEGGFVIALKPER
jgi:hypothetical protein